MPRTDRRSTSRKRTPISGLVVAALALSMLPTFATFARGLSTSPRFYRSLRRLAATTALALIGLIALPSWASAADENLLTNPGFEAGRGNPDGSEGWTGIPGPVFELQDWTSVRYEGQWFAELNGNGNNEGIYQDVVTVPGEELRWSLAHRAREGGGATDAMKVFIGPGGGAGIAGLQEQEPETRNGQAVASGTQIAASTTTWAVWGGSYTVPTAQVVTRFAMIGVSTTFMFTSMANLVDDIRVLRPGPPDEPTNSAALSTASSPIHQGLPLPTSGSCSDVDESAIGWATDLVGGWGKSWEPWAGDGDHGGWACTRILEYTEGAWHIAE